ncbi:hypothetical protein SEVIR_5G221720v4 [Setaria viridis]
MTHPVGARASVGTAASVIFGEYVERRPPRDGRVAQDAPERGEVPFHGPARRRGVLERARGARIPDGLDGDVNANRRAAAATSGGHRARDVRTGSQEPHEGPVTWEDIGGGQRTGSTIQKKSPPHHRIDHLASDGLSEDIV